MRVAVKDHLAESQPFVSALANAGHEISSDGPTDLFLIDLDPDDFGYRELIDFYRDCGAVVLQYPHGAPLSTLCYDNIYSPYEKVDGQLTASEGEILFLRAIGVDRPAKAVGWTLCRQFEFRGTEKPRRVVFAPTHVNADGCLDDDRVKSNRSVFRELLEGGWEVVVRFVGELEKCGLWRDERVFRYVVGDRDMSTVEIDAADCVVAGAGTYPCLAVARGAPTIMYDQFAGAMYGTPDEKPVPLRNLKTYRGFVGYPFDASRDPLSELVPRACRDEDAIREWRRLWIGEPFDSVRFVREVEEWVLELKARRPVAATS